jgi:hypothetical protein
MSSWDDRLGAEGPAVYQWETDPAIVASIETRREEAIMPTVTESDTVIVTRDGRAQLDVEKLFQKAHVQESLRQMREKIEQARRSTDAPRVETERPKPR